jgi:hypothetical protein
VDEKSQIQALNRTAPTLPLRPGLPEKASPDHARHGTTTTLFAAWRSPPARWSTPATTGTAVRSSCGSSSRSRRPPTPPAAARRGRQLRHHKHPAVQAWLAKNKRVTLHFASSPRSWLLAQRRRGLLLDHHPTGNPPRRFHLRARLIAIRRYIDDWNNRCPPPGPRPPTRSFLTPPAVKELQSQDTRRSGPHAHSSQTHFSRFTLRAIPRIASRGWLRFDPQPAPQSTRAAARAEACGPTERRPCKLPSADHA